MSRLDPASIDLATLAWLAGSSANEQLLRSVRGSAHPKIRNAHGYLFQHLLETSRTVGELSELLGVTQQAVSKSILELESLGYLERQPDETDSRLRRVALTAKGRAVVARARAARAALEAKLVKKLGTRGAAAAREALLAILEITGGLARVSRRSVKPPSL